MLSHTIVMGILPEDAQDLLAEMNRLSADGFVTISTTCALDATGKLQFIATMGKPLAKSTEGRRTISMSGGGPQGPSNVDTNAAPQQESPAGG